MNIIAVDDERRALSMIEKALRHVVPDATVTGFTSAGAALAYAEETRVDVAFLDIMMGEMNGLVLAKQLKDLNGSTNIIFVTAYSEYAGNAFDLRASGYLVKPINPDRLADELKNLRNPIVKKTPQRVRIQCFGSFAVFVDDKPLLFPRAKPKELMAYLVHKHGAAVTNTEIATVLWEDRANTLSVQSNTRNVISQLLQTLKQAGVEDIICKARNNTAIDTGRVACDYYDFLRGKTEAVNTYTGEYMNDYSWAEFTGAYLSSKKE